MKKLRIGILIHDFKDLENWELRIIEGIKNDPDLELALFIMDKRQSKLGKFNRSKNLTFNQKFSNFLFKKQKALEKKRYLCNKETLNKDLILSSLKNISILEISFTVENETVSIDKMKVQQIKNYKLDLILNLAFSDSQKDIIDLSKHGTWMLVHSKQAFEKGGDPGFWEVLNKEPGVEVLLVKQIKEKNQFQLLDQAFFNRHLWSFVITDFMIKESAVSLILKNLRRLQSDNLQSNLRKIELPNHKKLLKVSAIGKYLFLFYQNYINNKISSFKGDKNKGSQYWTLFIGQGNFLEADISKLDPLKVPSDEFWADPFLFKYKGEYFVFFEKYSYQTKRGVISCGKVSGNQLLDIVDVLDLDYHLSYPFVFEEDGEIFMIPETGQNKRLEIYKCKNFPSRWELYSTGFEGESVQDTTLFIDEKKQKWLFLNKVVASNVDRTSELYIYKIDSLKLDKIEAHKQNPVIIDSRVARNAGAIFKNNEIIFRPSQSNTDGVYGKALNINQITNLTIEEYKEKLIRKFEPNFRKNMVSIHHLHQIDGIFVFDGAFKLN